MADRIIKGQVLYAGTPDGIQGLEIAIVDLDPLFTEEVMGKSPTGSDGRFVITVSDESSHAWITPRNPDIVVRVYAAGGRLLYETPERSNVKDLTLTIPNIEIHRANVEGWLVTNATLKPNNPKLNPDGTPITWTQGNRVQILKDGETVFPQLTDAITQAQTSVNFMNMNFWLGKNLITKFDPSFNPDQPVIGSPVQGERIHEVLKTRAANLSSANLLVQDIPFVDQLPVISFLLRPFFNPDTSDEVRQFFEGSTVKTRSLPAVRIITPLISFLHSKAVILDSKIAFVMGSTISQSYFGDNRHLIRDARHGGSLIHDMNIKVEGPAVEHIDRSFTTLWNAANSSAAPLTPSTGQTPVEQPGLGIQIVRTLPGNMLSAANTGGDPLDHGETGCLEAYQRAIANAERYIYLEDQYFTAPEIFDAMLDRMKKTSKLEIILVINAKPDVSGYPELQIQLIKQFQQDLEKALGKEQARKRLGIYTIWSCDETKPRYEALPIYVHSKSALVDDLWATIGSANLDGASLNQIQIETIVTGVLASAVERGSLWKRVLFTALMTLFTPLIIAMVWVSKLGFARLSQHANPEQSRQPSRSSELNVVICEKAPQITSPNHVVVDLRNNLWGEHLGLGSPLPAPVNGWVELWDRRADEKMANLQQDPGKAVGQRLKHPAKVLKWQPQIEAEKYLNALGVKTDKIKVREDADSFDFTMGKWR